MGWEDTIISKKSGPKEGSEWIDPSAAAGWESTITSAPAASAAASEDPSELESVGQGIGQGISFGLSDEIYGGRKALADTVFGDEKYSDLVKTYLKHRDAARASLEKHRETNPKSYYGGEIGGGIATSVIPGLNVAKGASLGKQAANLAAQGAAEGYGKSTADSALGQLHDTTRGAAIGAVTPSALSGAGKAIKGGYRGAKKLIPGSKESLEWINKKVGRAADFVPGADYQTGVLEKLLNKGPKGRRHIRETADDLTEKATTYSKVMSKVEKVSKELMGVKYQKGEAEFFKGLKEEDYGKLLPESFDPIMKKIEASPEEFGTGGKYLQKAFKMIKYGVSDEIDSPTFGRALDKLPVFAGEGLRGSAAGASKDIVRIQANRLLKTRRFLDDLTQSKNFQNMLAGERDAVIEFRKLINYKLRDTSSGTKLAEADAAYTEFASASKNALNKIEATSPAGVREITPEKMSMFLKSESSQAKFIDRAMSAYSDVLEKLERGVGDKKVLKGVVDSIKEMRDTLKNARDLDNLKRGSGGPTSQAINGAMQVMIGYGTNGLSALALPITNPHLWMKVVDSASPIEKAFLSKLSSVGQKMLRAYPRATTQLYLMGKQEDSPYYTEPRKGADVPMPMGKQAQALIDSMTGTSQIGIDPQETFPKGQISPEELGSMQQALPGPPIFGKLLKGNFGKSDKAKDIDISEKPNLGTSGETLTEREKRIRESLGKINDLMADLRAGKKKPGIPDKKPLSAVDNVTDITSKAKKVSPADDAAKAMERLAKSVGVFKAQKRMMDSFAPKIKFNQLDRDDFRRVFPGVKGIDTDEGFQEAKAILKKWVTERGAPMDDLRSQLIKFNIDPMKAAKAKKHTSFEETLKSRMKESVGGISDMRKGGHYPLAKKPIPENDLPAIDSLFKELNRSPRNERFDDIVKILKEKWGIDAG